MKKTYKDGGEEIGSFTSIKRQNEQLKASLEEAHKELRKMQTGHSLEKVAVTSDIKELLHRTYRTEKRMCIYALELFNHLKFRQS